MYENIFKSIGLTQTQAQVLSFLIEKGEHKASEIAQEANMIRGVVYKGLEELVNMGLVEKIEKPNQIARFRAEHPTKIELMFDQKEREAERGRLGFRESLPDLISTYNLTINKPGVRFYEGNEGIKRVLFDSLRSKTEIYTYADVEAVEENLKEINDEYVKKREKQGIIKKLIVPDTAKSREIFKNYNAKYTVIKFIKQEYYHFLTGMQIYDNKISYQTLTKENKIGVIIEDANIYQMHKLFFEYIWNSLPET